MSNYLIEVISESTNFYFNSKLRNNSNNDLIYIVNYDYPYINYNHISCIFFLITFFYIFFICTICGVVKREENYLNNNNNNNNNNNIDSIKPLIMNKV